MTDPADLYAAILAAPNDLDLRLAYADAIEATDPDHAELIRVQIDFTRREHIRVERMETGDLPEEISAVYGRGYRLARRIGDRLAAPIAGLVRRFHFACGFPETVTLSGAAFLENGRILYERVPVRHAFLMDVDASLVATLADSPLLDQLVSISLLDCRIGSDGVRALVASEHLRGLRWLDLSNCGIGQIGAEALAEAAPASLPNLQWLGFAQNTPFIPYGEGIDAISGKEPVDTYIPEFGVRLNERYGPFPWMRPKWLDVATPPYLGTV
ncbi:TIGR02996 domain-containing protein [Actinoplanes sp. NPDC049668]|uniref:TIGR02996 domain-containing protein n=1 Tax=unclassified Actinoplanes TaxID=2626549 RepID=UPI0033A11489